ncbi:MAG TPA: V-type ATPase subunit [Syntrophales bacterium]|nr:V-type ATPase subunit [Syntrophales bacterium]HPQ45603.1 V-type ATPase subunit [Syntrophales bacterium]
MNLLSTRYAFISAYLKGEESRSVTSEHFDDMLQRSATIQDALEIIGDTDIGEYLLDQPIKVFDDVDEYLWAYLDACLKRLGQFNTPPDVALMTRLYVEKFDVLNIRTALRVILKRERSSLVPVGTIHDRGYLHELSSVREKDELYPILVACNLGTYIQTIENIKEKDGPSVLGGEIVLQNLYHRKMLEALQGMDDGDLLEKAYRIGIDTANLQTVFRISLTGHHIANASILSGGRMFSENTIQELLTLKMSEITGRLEHTGYYAMAQEVSKEYEKGGQITAVDKVTEKYKFRMLRDMLSPRILSSTNMAWYLLIKEWEIRNLRLTFKILADGIPPSEIKDLVIAA